MLFNTGMLTVSIAFLTSIVSATTLQSRDYAQTDFFSAIHRNICGELNSKQHTYQTESCECISPNIIQASCRSATNQLHQHVRHCSTKNRNVVCLPSENSPTTGPDCACKPEQRKKGSKASNDKDGIACSGGVHFLAANAREVDAIDVWSTITASPSDKVHSCWVQDNKGRTLSTYAPCIFKAGGVPLRIPLHSSGGRGVATYQACIKGSDNDPTKIDFKWVLTSPSGKNKKGRIDSWY